MLNLKKTYKVRSNATRDLKKAIANGEVSGEDLKVQKVDDVFQIMKIVTGEPKPVEKPVEVVDVSPAVAKTVKSGEMSEYQKTALNALLGVKSLEGKEEKVGTWFPFAEIYESSVQHDIPKRSMGGIMSGLINKGFIEFEKGAEGFAKSVVAVCVTSAGLAEAQGMPA